MISAENYNLTLPKKGGVELEVESNQSVFLIGANGAGKTRLGTWIEMKSPQRKMVHRLSAQKSLAMPENITPVPVDRAEKALLFGSHDFRPGKEDFSKTHNRWNSKPAVGLLNDYEKLLVYLFSNETEENAKYKAAQKTSTARLEPPKTKLDLLKEVWERILPHRELIYGGLDVKTKVKGGNGELYSSSEMSDGERVIFYLIGQCLAAPKNGIIVIDEPELHLHKSIQAPLWMEIEKLRQDCLFVYLTHDVDFAASKVGSKIIWIKSFDGHEWEWEEIQDDAGLPNELLLEIIGSRKPVVFVEGDSDSDDVSLYREMLPSFLVVPRGSCSKVIQSVKALKESPQLHHLSVYGIIDRDRRTDIEIAALEKDFVYVLSVAEVENLFCTKEVLEIVSKRLARDPDKDFSKVANAIFSKLKAELDVQVSMRVASEIKFRLNCFDDKAKGVQGLNAALHQLTQSIDVASIYKEVHDDFSAVLSTSDYERLLALYNRKSLASQVAGSLGLKNGELSELVLRMAKIGSQDEIKNALRKYFGNFSSMMN